MALPKSKLLRFHLPGASICQNVLQIRDRGAPGVEFLLDDVADLIVKERKKARDKHGWIMDTYLIKKR